jgi:hypothetical protein
VLMIGTTNLEGLAYAAERKAQSFPHDPMAAAGRLFRQLEAGAGAFQLWVKAVDLYAALKLLGTYPPNGPDAPMNDPRAHFRTAAELFRKAYPNLDVTSGVVADAAPLWDAAARSAESRDKHPLTHYARELRTRKA